MTYGEYFTKEKQFKILIVGKYANDKPFANVYFHKMKPCSNLSLRLYLSSLVNRWRCRRAMGLSQAYLAIDPDMEVSQISRI